MTSFRNFEARVQTNRSFLHNAYELRIPVQIANLKNNITSHSPSKQIHSFTQNISQTLLICTANKINYTFTALCHADETQSRQEPPGARGAALRGRRDTRRGRRRNSGTGNSGNTRNDLARSGNVRRNCGNRRKRRNGRNSNRRRRANGDRGQHTSRASGSADRVRCNTGRDGRRVVNLPNG